MVSILTFKNIDTMNRLTKTLLYLVLLGLGIGQNAAQNKESDYYKIEKFFIPEHISLEVGGLAFNDKGQLGVITRRGELWLILNPENKESKYVRFAYGLHEPLGLLYHEGAFYSNQRGELTKLIDKDDDNIADVYETIASWELNGNYHEYSYGPILLPDGDLLVTLNLGWIGRGESGSKWRGWMLKVSKNGEVQPFATGLRSPAGFGLNDQGDIFYTENQGDWVGSGRMTHLTLGDFAGNPEGLKWSSEKGSPTKLKFADIDDTKGLSLYEYQQELKGVKAPSVWFPHTLMGISTSGFALFSEKMGPFKGQILVGDQGHSKIMRVYQEKINGVYQGVCFPFREGFASGVLRLEYNPAKDALYVGQTSRGWGATGSESYALERMIWTGKMPFEIKTIQVHPEGFQLTFTQPVNSVSASNPASYQITDFTYLYHHFYGSPVEDKQARTISQVDVAPDRMSALLKIDQFRKGYIYEIKASGVQNTAGQLLLHDFGYYTLNEIPAGNPVLVKSNQPKTSDTISSSKRLTVMPEIWNGKVEADIALSTVPGLKFDKTQLMVEAGTNVRLTFHNADDMPHNFLLSGIGQADKIGKEALQLGLDGESMNYVPNSPDVVVHTKLLAPDEIETIYFTAPESPGDYPFLCTFPGHYLTMRGILTVKAK
jgi:azurin